MNFRARAARSIALAAVLALAPIAHAVQPGFRIYADQDPLVPFSRLLVGITVPKETPLSQLTAQGFANGAAIEAASAWTLLAPATGRDVVIHMVPADSRWTCYLPDTSSCGFDTPGVEGLLATDDFYPWGDPSYRSITAVDWVPERATVFMRASAIDEGDNSEIRLCLDPAQGRPEVPLVVFPRLDGNRRYLAAGDPAWASPVFDCVPAATNNGPCGAPGGTLVRLAAGGTTNGKITTRIVKPGTLTLPSGHVIDCMLLETLTSYRLHEGSFDTSCFLSPISVHSYQLVWLAPEYGAIASIASPRDAANVAAWTTPEASFIGEGLLPPLSIRLDAASPTSLTVSWDPGTIAPRTSGHVVHWGTVSGHDVAPPSSSPVIPSGTNAFTIDGLAPDTRYFVSVSSSATYADRVSGIVTEYRSVELPRSVGADVNGDGVRDTSYPPEIAASTLPITCVKGDISPDGVGDGRVSLADFALARRKITGAVPLNARDAACGDVHPGQVTCAPPSSASSWCVAGDGALGLGDAVVIRRVVSGAIRIGCAACEGARAPSALAVPGDVAPAARPDGRVDVADAVLVLRAAVGLEELAPARPSDVAPLLARGVAGGDGVVDVADAVAVLRASVGLEQLAWPVREVSVTLDVPGTASAATVAVTGWPAWASPEGASFAGCGEPLDATGDRWALTCAGLALPAGPASATFRYRAPDAIHPDALRGEGVVLDAMDRELGVTATLR